MRTVLCVLMLLTGFQLASGNPQPERPNVLVILTDDQGYADAGFQGSKDIKTPYLDRLAAQGVRCTDGYVTFSVCSPSRAGLLTGRIPQRFGYERNPAPLREPHVGLSTNETTMATYLQRAGYTTGVIGKWHLGLHEVFHPNVRGFDFFYGFTHGGHCYFPEEYAARRVNHPDSEYLTSLERNGEELEETGYLTDILTREALSFIRQSKSKPFFLYLAYNAPHTPMEASEKYLKRFPNINDEGRRIYAAMLSAVDDGVGEVTALLDELGLAENTLIFFLSDNGGATRFNSANNRPLRGAKTTFFEGGLRVPFVVKWTGRLPAGVDYKLPVSSLDIAATAMALAGVEADPQRPLDGVNLLPYLTGENAGIPHDMLWWRWQDHEAWAVRRGDHKMMNWHMDAPGLYNVRTDRSEKNSLLERYPEQAEELRRIWEALDQQMIDPVFPAPTPKKH